jgi:hypothetical protein
LLGIQVPASQQDCLRDGPALLGKLERRLAQVCPEFLLPVF